MAGYFDLPRGRDGQEGDSPLATGRWATPDEIAEFEYQSGDIYLGTLPVPSPEAAQQIERLRSEQTSIALDTSRDPQARSVEIDAIEDEIIALSETDAIDIGLRDDRHHIDIAGSRAGKTTTILAPTLARYPGSVVATDPKGELFRMTSGMRSLPISEGGLGQRCLVLDPYGTTGLPVEERACWNPLDLIDPEDEQAIDMAAGISDAFIVRTNPENEHFDDSARIFLKGLTLFVAERHAGRATRNLVTTYDYLMRGAPLEQAANKDGIKDAEELSAFFYLLAMMRLSEAFDGVVAAAAESVLSMGERERGSVLSTARRSMEFLERGPMRRVFASSSFDLDSLKTDPKGLTLYLCLPPQRMHDCGRFLRIGIALMLERIYELDAPPATGHPVLAMLEEFPVLSHMSIIEQAAGYAAGFGLKLRIVIQDLTQLKRHYRDGWETFIGNAGCIQAFANNDVTTLEYVSKKLGECEVTQTTHNLSTASGTSTNDASAHAQVQSLMSVRGDAGIMTGPLSLMADPTATGTSTSTTESWNTQKTRTPLMLPGELQQFLGREAGNQVVMIAGRFPMLLRRST